MARFPYVKTLSQFEIAFQPSIDECQAYQGERSEAWPESDRGEDFVE